MVGLGLMKNIDVKSLIIGALLTSTIFLGVAATSPTDKWDEKQKWEIHHEALKSGLTLPGWEPFAYGKRIDDGVNLTVWRRRVK